MRRRCQPCRLWSGLVPAALSRCACRSRRRPFRFRGKDCCGMKTFDLSLYLVLDPDLCHAIGMVETARLAVAGGVTMVQSRDKSADPSRRIETGRALKAGLAGTAVPLIVNYHAEAATCIARS